MGRFNIVFMGTPQFAVPALKRLIQGPDVISAVVSQPDRPRGRGRQLLHTPVKEVALDAGLTVLQPRSVKDPVFIEDMKSLFPDLFVVAAFGQILPATLLAVPNIMPINIHGSLLPALRGAAPIQWAILNNLPETGITIMKMDEGMDTGPMLLQKSMPIEEDETSGTLFVKMADLGGDLLMSALEKFDKGELKPLRQPEKGVSFAPPLKKEMSHIDWNRTAVETGCHIRAFDPSPGAWTEWQGQRLRLYSPFCDEIYVEGRPVCGTVTSVTEDSVFVAVSDGVIGVREIQYPGKKRMSCADFLRGRKIRSGDLFK